jgi:glycosyltransferase involved in cell wall biosynthesis
MRVGVAANEFFDTTLGRIGGFGWAARRLARTLPQAGHSVVLFSGEHQTASTLDGAPLVPQRRRLFTYMVEARRHPIDLLVTIDYRANYLPTLLAFPRTPLIIWIRDPVDAEKRRIVGSLRVPGDPPWRPPEPPSYSSLPFLTFLGRLARRPVALATTAPDYLIPRARRLPGCGDADVQFLPNPIGTDVSPVTSRSARPRFVFMARPDPVKRPWLFVELARRVPDGEFLLAGTSTGGRWCPENPPPNLTVLGHVDGPEKTELLSSAWALVNTSIDEGLPISFLESLACGTPIVAAVDPERTVSRFGRFVGRWPGDGLTGLDEMASALRYLIEHSAERDRLGAAGRAWVTTTHSEAAFCASFEQLSARLRASNRYGSGGGVTSWNSSE